jgi:hypothetical protein
MNDLIVNFVKNHLSEKDFNHTLRVVNVCKKIANGSNGVDLQLLLISAYLSNIIFAKKSKDLDVLLNVNEYSANMAKDVLISLKYSESRANDVFDVIFGAVSFNNERIEQQILYEAMKIQWYGAVGFYYYGSSIGFENYVEIISKEMHDVADGFLSDVGRSVIEKRVLVSKNFIDSFKDEMKFYGFDVLI